MHYSVRDTHGKTHSSHQAISASSGPHGRAEIQSPEEVRGLSAARQIVYRLHHADTASRSAENHSAVHWLLTDCRKPFILRTCSCSAGRLNGGLTGPPSFVKQEDQPGPSYDSLKGPFSSSGVSESKPVPKKASIIWAPCTSINRSL